MPEVKVPDAPKGSVKALRGVGRWFRPYRRALSIALLALAVAAATVLALGQGLRVVVDEGIAAGNEALLYSGIQYFVGAALLLALASYTRSRLISNVGDSVAARIRRDLLEHWLRLDPHFHERHTSGDLIARLSADTAVLQLVLTGALPVAVRNILTAVGGTALMVWASPHLAVLVLLSLPLVLVPPLLFGRKVRQLSRTVQDQGGKALGAAQQALQAVRTVQAYTAEPNISAELERAETHALRIAHQRNRQRALLAGLVIAIVFLSLGGVLWYGGLEVLHGTITAGTLTAFLFYALVVAGAIGALSEVIGDLQKAGGAAERLVASLATRSQLPVLLPLADKHSFRGGIQFDEVRFCYPLAPDVVALKDIRLDITPGETIAVVGTSGAGKSTLFQLMLRFYDPESGVVRLDGVDIRHIPLRTLRQQIAWVAQEPVLFDATLRANVVFGFDGTVPDAAVWTALEQAAAAPFVRALPEGLDTPLGERGIRLSVGQKQRLALARALLRSPKILLLDEFTASLDALAEDDIIKALEPLRGKTTIILSAHRMATVRMAERIIVLQGGVIEASGSHEALLVSSPLYQQLTNLQANADNKHTIPKAIGSL
ncbi:MAG: ABC transporter ATP-binding protein/permease [Alphaproteobacteria bacterium]|nr:ABC transporter ATP-binding protein/permease [Alphaproteobacteria bacterium]